MSKEPTFLSLFSGIGGLDLGLERAGWTCVGQVENDPYCQRVLAKHWPDVPRWGDIKEIDPDELPRADLICGGFPCQPVSLAGRRRGQDDERWLWPELHRIVRALRPRWVLLENVPGLLVPWRDDDGGWNPAPVEEVLGDLAACGYDAEWDCIPASAVGAHHQRDRVWVVAYPQGIGESLQPGFPDRPSLVSAGAGAGGRTVAGDPAEGVRDLGRTPTGGATALGHAAGSGRLGAANGHREHHAAGRPERGDPKQAGFADQASRQSAALADSSGQGLRPRPRLGWSRPTSERDGGWSPEPDVGRMVDGVSTPLDRARVRGLGNAVVPQVAELIGRRILEVV